MPLNVGSSDTTHGSQEGQHVILFPASPHELTSSLGFPQLKSRRILENPWMMQLILWRRGGLAQFKRKAGINTPRLASPHLSARPFNAEPRLIWGWRRSLLSFALLKGALKSDDESVVGQLVTTSVSQRALGDVVRRSRRNPYLYKVLSSPQSIHCATIQSWTALSSSHGPPQLHQDT